MFHNFNHAVMVCHGCYMISAHTSIRLVIPASLYEFALVVSGLMHDIKHTARTNLFEVNSQSPLALRYHDS